MERWCAGVIDGAGLARGEMGEDLLDEFGRFDVRDDAQRTVTHGTVFDVDVEDALEPLHPTHGSATRRMRLSGGLVDRVGDDAVAVLAVRGEQAVVSGEPLLLQGAGDPGGDGVEQALEFGLGRSGDTVDTGRFVIERVGAVDEEHVQMGVEVQRRAEALDEGDGSGAGAGA